MIKPRLAGLEAMYAQKPDGGTQVGASAKGASAIVPGQRSLTRRVRAERSGGRRSHARRGQRRDTWGISISQERNEGEEGAADGVKWKERERERKGSWNKKNQPS